MGEHTLSSFGEFGATSHWVGRLSFVVALCATGILEHAQFRLRFLEAKTWWASNGRDLLNAAAFAALWAACGLIGFSGPMGLVIAATVLVLINVLQSAVGLRRGAVVISVMAALALGLPVAIAPRAVDGLLRSLLATLFGL